MSDLSNRYERVAPFPSVQEAGGSAWSESSVLVVGAGALGAPVLCYLVGAGVGTVRVCDPDSVEASNLPRQTLYTEADVNQPKVWAAERFLSARNRDVRIEAVPIAFDEQSAPELLAGCGCAVDCADSFRVSYALARACHGSGCPYVYGGVASFDGQLMAVLPGETACLACLFGDAPPETERTGATEGVFAPVAGVVGAAQAGEALKLLAGTRDGILADRLLVWNGRNAEPRSVPISRRADCVLCGDKNR